MKTVKIYTDGACSSNQTEENIGGWGAILTFGENRKELFDGEVNTTNNRMEMKALIFALKALKKEGLEVQVFSDSAYLVNCFEKKWYVNWQKNGWKNSKKQPVENKDLWEMLLEEVNKHTIEFFKIKGHLLLDKPNATVDKWYADFKKSNPKKAFTKEEFLTIARENIQADALANQGVDKIRNQT